MNYSEQEIPIIPDGWSPLILESREFIIKLPNAVLANLVLMPHPSQALDLCEMYGASDKNKADIHALFQQKKSPPSWPEIKKILKRTNSEKLYSLVARNAYRLPQVFDIESQEILQAHHNTVIQLIKYLLVHPPEKDLAVKKFFESKQDVYHFSDYLFLHTVQRYCHLMLPRPYNPITDYRKLAKSLQIEEKITDEVKTRFSLYHLIDSKLNNFYSQMDEESRIEIESLDFKHSDDLIRQRRSIDYCLYKRNISKIPTEYLLAAEIGNFYQCPFCYRFSLAETPHKGKSFPQHCNRSECGDAYERWKVHLKGQGISSKS